MVRVGSSGILQPDDVAHSDLRAPAGSMQNSTSENSDGRSWTIRALSHELAQNLELLHKNYSPVTFYEYLPQHWNVRIRSALPRCQAMQLKANGALCRQVLKLQLVVSDKAPQTRFNDEKVYILNTSFTFEMLNYCFNATPVSFYSHCECH